MISEEHHSFVPMYYVMGPGTITNTCSVLGTMNDGVLSFPQKKIPTSVLRSVSAEVLFIMNLESES
jgi:hypothetical protein